MVNSILWTCILIAVLVFGVMIYSIATFSAASDGTPANFRPRALIEVMWALIPIAIVIGAALPAARLPGLADINVAGVESGSQHVR